MSEHKKELPEEFKRDVSILALMSFFTQETFKHMKNPPEGQTTADTVAFLFDRKDRFHKMMCEKFGESYVDMWDVLLKSDLTPLATGSVVFPPQFSEDLWVEKK